MSKISEPRGINTWDNRSFFDYNGSVKQGTMICYGTGRRTFVSASIYEEMLKHFGGKTVDCGTSRSYPQVGSLGEWIQENLVKRTLASYVGAILVREG